MSERRLGYAEKNVLLATRILDAIEAERAVSICRERLDNVRVIVTACLPSLIHCSAVPRLW